MPEIKNLQKSARRIKKAIAKQEKIILFSDADLDGTTSLLILEETIKSLGGKIHITYFPDREKEGYGLNLIALEKIKQNAPALLILLDCGIGNFQELKIAKDLGFKTIVIDHHEILNNIPSADIVVDPKQPSDSFPFKKLSTASIVYRLALVLLEDKLFSYLNQSFMELAALGTIADMMPEEDTNKAVIEGGLSSIFFTLRPGLKIIIEIAGLKQEFPRQVFQKLSSILNITEVKNNLTESYLLLSSFSQDEARNLADTILIESQQRCLEIKDIVQEVVDRIEEAPSAIIFEGNVDWSSVLTGAVASRLCNKYRKPSFIFKIGREVSRGSVRMPQGLNGVAALMHCSSLLEIYGGHPAAAGFTVKNENIDKLKECLEKYFTGNNQETITKKQAPNKFQ